MVHTRQGSCCSVESNQALDRTAPHVGYDDLEALFWALVGKDEGEWLASCQGGTTGGLFLDRLRERWPYPIAGAWSGLDETTGYGGVALRANAGSLIGRAVEEKGCGLDATL